MKNKVIHYCWFGPKPIPKLAKKCIASWEKYMPDYEIKLWSEKNVDLEECAFIKEAYENKKWAFVADYVRTKVLYEQGGIYMDTDMELTKSLEPLMTEDFVIGVEDSGYIAAGLIVVKNKKNKYIKKMLDFYQSKSFNEIEDLFEISIPKVLTNVFKDDVDLSDTSKIIKIVLIIININSLLYIQENTFTHLVMIERIIYLQKILMVSIIMMLVG